MKPGQNMPTDGQMTKLARAARMKELVALPQWADVQAILVSEWQTGLDMVRNAECERQLIEGRAIIVAIERIVATITADIKIGEIEQRKIEASLNTQKRFSDDRR